MSGVISQEESPCPTTAACPHSVQQFESTAGGATFPTEAVLGGTLGGLSVIVLALLLYAACRHWSKGRRRRRPSLCRRAPVHRKKTSSALFGDPLFAYDVDALPKAWHTCSHVQPDVRSQVYIARPFVSDRRQLIQRQVLAAMLDSRDDSSDREFCPRSGGRGGGGGGGGRRGSDESKYEPSIIAGSFVYHPPTNLPPHLKKASHAAQPRCHSPGVLHRELRPDLSYDSFKNNHLHLQDGSARGVASSTLNNQHQPSDFYL